MQRKLDSYSSLDEFDADIELILDNCRRFNGPGYYTNVIFVSVVSVSVVTNGILDGRQVLGSLVKEESDDIQYYCSSSSTKEKPSAIS